VLGLFDVIVEAAARARVERGRDGDGDGDDLETKHCLGAARMNALAAEENRTRDMHKRCMTGRVDKGNTTTTARSLVLCVPCDKPLRNLSRCRLICLGIKMTWKVSRVQFESEYVQYCRMYELGSVKYTKLHIRFISEPVPRTFRP
jgi:hypothetical protein